MKWELYLSRQEWEELKAAVRERTRKDAKGRPLCERCNRPHGQLRRGRTGYLVPRWLHTAHKRGAPMRSKNPDDYFALCDACHMSYDREADGDGSIAHHRQGYRATTTDQLIAAVRIAGLEVWEEHGWWYWQIGRLDGAEETPVEAVAAAVAQLGRLAGMV